MQLEAPSGLLHGSENLPLTLTAQRLLFRERWVRSALNGPPLGQAVACLPCGGLALFLDVIAYAARPPIRPGAPLVPLSASVSSRSLDPARRQRKKRAGEATSQ
jgi:hypothetical protein